MKKIITLAFVLFFTYQKTFSQLIASENFNYPTGNITGNNGGTGWTGAWLTTTFNTANTTIVAPGQTMPPQITGVGFQDHQVGNDFRNFRYLDTTSVLALSLMDNVGDPGATSSTNYKWGKAYGKDGTTIWFAFLFYRSNSTQGYGGMHLMYGMNLAFDQYGDKKAHQRFQFGADNSNTKYILSRTINANPNLPSSCGLTIAGNTLVNGTLHLLVHRIDFKLGKETAYMWVDPPSCTQPDTALASTKMYNICDFRFNAVNIGSGNSANYEFDELRIGTTFNSIINCASGLNENPNTAHLSKIYPNPSNENSTFTFYSENETEVSALVVNMLGETIQSKKLKTIKGINNVDFDLKNYENGIYFVKLISGNTVISTNKIVLEK